MIARYITFAAVVTLLAAAGHAQEAPVCDQVAGVTVSIDQGPVANTDADKTITVTTTGQGNAVLFELARCNMNRGCQVVAFNGFDNQRSVEDTETKVTLTGQCTLEDSIPLKGTKVGFTTQASLRS